MQNISFVTDSTGLDVKRQHIAYVEFPVLFVTTDCPNGFFEHFGTTACNLLYIPENGEKIYNTFNEAFGAYRHWANEFQIAVLRNCSTRQLVEMGATMMHGPVFLLNVGYSLVEYSMGGRERLPAEILPSFVGKGAEISYSGEKQPFCEPDSGPVHPVGFRFD